MSRALCGQHFAQALLPLPNLIMVPGPKRFSVKAGQTGSTTVPRPYVSDNQSHRSARPPEPQPGSIWADLFGCWHQPITPGFRQLLGLMNSGVISMYNPNKVLPSTEGKKLIRTVMNAQKVNCNCWEAAASQ